MKKITRRITALVIAAIMLASMIPAAFATTGEETVKEKYTFEFNYNSHKGLSSNTATSSGDFSVENTAEGYDKWGYVNAIQPQNRKVYNNRLAYTYRVTRGYVFNPDATPAVLPPFLALEIVVDEPGTYTPSLTWQAGDKSPYVDIYLIKAPEGAEAEEWKEGNTEANNPAAKKCLSYLSENDKLGTVMLQSSGGGNQSPYDLPSSITIADGAGENYYLIFVPNGASDTVKDIYDTDSSSNKVYCDITLKSFSLTRVADDPIEEAFEVTEATTKYTAPTAIGLTKDETEIETTDNKDGTFDLTAPETNSKEEKFLYWALGLTGNKRIVSFDRTLENYMPAEEGRNYLIAVYEGDVDADKVEYYNQNGQLIPDANENTQVSMPGYGSTSKWKKHSDNIYVADYEKTEAQRDNVTVTVVGGTGNVGEVPFGTEVTCTADETKGTFKCWKKSDLNGDEIVSVDKTYSFKAWETCTVEAVYGKHIYFGNNMKIIIDDFAAGDETGIMAEFIGLDSAVEKGIMFTSEKNTTQIAMTTKDSQFTVIADEEGTYVGYAILKSGDNAFTLITDGSYEK